jgi:hypothetical protein
MHIYGPCTSEYRDIFFKWIFELNIPDDEDWILVGDFNFYRYVESRNKPGANFHDMNIFNDIISHLGLVELPIKGRTFTWSNMQQNPLLVQLDWFFTSTNWTLSFPNTVVNPLARPVSDHLPCVINIGTKIPKASIFRFENYWIRQPGFMQLVDNIWALFVHRNAAKRINAKFKLLRKGLKKWSGNLSNIDTCIDNCNKIIFMLDEYEDARELHITEWNFRRIVKERYMHLSDCKRDIWKNRCTIRWAKLGDENTSFFHSMATIRYRQNCISKFTLPDGREVSDHNEKAALLYTTYKERLGQSRHIHFPHELQSLIEEVDGLHSLSAVFTKEEIDEVIKELPTDKAPGPDGFNGMFIKRCWHIIKQDFYDLCKDFFGWKSGFAKY